MNKSENNTYQNLQDTVKAAQKERLITYVKTFELSHSTILMMYLKALVKQNQIISSKIDEKDNQNQRWNWQN